MKIVEQYRKQPPRIAADIDEGHRDAIVEAITQIKLDRLRRAPYEHRKTPLFIRMVSIISGEAA